MKSTLQSKISFAMWVIAAICTLASAALTGWLIVTSHRESVRQQLQATATSLVTLGITQFSELKDFGELNRFVEDALQMDRIDKIIRVYDGGGKLIFTTAGVDYDVLPEKLDREIKKPVFLTVEGRQRRYDSLVMPYEGAGSKKTFYLQVAIPLPKYSELLGHLWWQSILLFGFLIAVSVALSQWLSKRLLKPVGVIARHLEGMDPASIDEWRPLELDERSRYLKSIVEGINLLSDRTRAAIMQMKKMSRYVAHEMRTPLTILQGEAEMTLIKKGASGEDYERVLKSSLEEIQRMSEIVSTVLEVGEGAKAAPAKPVGIDLARWLQDNLGDWEKTLGRPIDLDVPAACGVHAKTDPKLLHRLIDNLVRNVKTHAPQEAGCAIFLNASKDGTGILVADDGPGLPQDVIDSLNEEGGFSDAAGVGLNLCHRIADVCGMGLRFSNRVGGGLAVEISF